jgi:uncharacterized membrane protein YebE (DUF533 family)
MGNQSFSKSQYYMWRAVIAIAHVDGEVQAEERAYLAKIVANLDRSYALTPEQKKAFEDDLHTPQKIEDMVKEIDDPQYRGMLITLGMTLVWSDGVVTSEEEAVLEKLHANQMSTLDSDKLRTELKNGLEKRRADYLAESAKLREEARGGSKLFRALDLVLMKMGVDLLK